MCVCKGLTLKAAELKKKSDFIYFMAPGHSCGAGSLLIPWHAGSSSLESNPGPLHREHGLCDPLDCSTPGFPVLHFTRVCSNSCPLSRGCHPTISSSAAPFSFCLQSFPAWEGWNLKSFLECIRHCSKIHCWQTMACRPNPAAAYQSVIRIHLHLFIYVLSTADLMLQWQN